MNYYNTTIKFNEYPALGVRTRILFYFVVLYLIETKVKLNTIFSLCCVFFVVLRAQKYFNCDFVLIFHNSLDTEWNKQQNIILIIALRGVV